MPNNESNKKPQHPLQAHFYRREVARHEVNWLRQQKDDEILAKARAIVGFVELERLYSFYIDRNHPDTLALTFGNRSLFRLTIDQKKTASESGPTLLYSLGHEGFFSTILYPAKSDYGSTFEDHLFLQIGETSSNKLIEGMQRDLKTLVAYAHVSSIEMEASYRERFSIWLLRLFARRTEKGQFKSPPFWQYLLGIVNFGGRTIATAIVLSLFKPFGVVVLLICFGYFGLDGLENLARSLFGRG